VGFDDDASMIMNVLGLMKQNVSQDTKSSFPLETAKVSACEKKRDDEEEEEETPKLRGGI